MCSPGCGFLNKEVSNFLFSLFLSGLLESSTRLKPHEAQNYRKKALWVSWLSIIVTLALAVAAFSKYPESCCSIRAAVVCFSLWLLGDALLLLVDYCWWEKNVFRWWESQGTYKLVKWLLSSAEGRGGLRRNGEGSWEPRLSSVCKFVEGDSGCKLNREDTLLVDAFSLGWHMTNLYPWDLYFEPNATRWVQYCCISSLFPPHYICVRFGWKSCAHFNERSGRVIC